MKETETPIETLKALEIELEEIEVKITRVLVLLTELIDEKREAEKTEPEC